MTGSRRVSSLCRIGIWAVACFGVAVCGQGGRCDEPPRPGRWFERCLVGMEVGPTGAQFGSDPDDVGYAAKFDGREIVRRCVAAGCEYVVIWARDGEYAYYNSKIMPKCPGLGDRDVLRETIEAAKKHNLPVIAYCVVQQGNASLKQHPEYAMRDSAGNPLGRFCYNSGYLDYMKGLAAEMLAYGIAGFHIDMIDQGFGPPYGCWCENCASKFQAETGHSLPRGVTWDEDWDRMLDFRYRSSERFERALRDHIRQLDPSAAVDFNYHGNPPFSWEVGQRPVQHAITGDFVTGETGVWGFSALGVGENAEFYEATQSGGRYQVAMQRGVRMYHDQTSRPLVDLRWELLTLLAHGAFVTMVDKTAYDGTLDPVAYDRIGAAFREARAKREHFGQPHVHEVGIYYSSRTRDWYGREDAAKYQQAFHGACRAMVYEHIPYGIVLDERSDLAHLKAFPVVLLPGVAILEPDEVASLRQYVAEGGNLIVTGITGLNGHRGEPLDRSVLEDLIGAKLRGVLDSRDNHERLPAISDGREQRLTDGIPTDWPFLVEGPAAVFEPTTGRAIGSLMKPHRTLRQRRGTEGTGWPMSADVAVGPGILVNRVGNGQVVTITSSPDWATAGEHPVVEARKLLRNAVRTLRPEPEIEIQAPAYVEAVVTDDPKARILRVHLLGYASPPAPTPARNRPAVIPSLLEDPVPFQARIHLRRSFRDARVLNDTSKLVVAGSDITVDVSDVHDVVVVSY